MADTSVYPGAIDAVADLPVDVTNDTDRGSGTPRTGTVGWAATLYNRWSSAVRHVELELGTDPSGTFTDVATRVNSRLTCRKTADQTLSSVVNNTAITDLVLPIATTGLDYWFRFHLAYTSAATANGIRIALSGPALTGYVSAEIRIYGRIANALGSATPPLVDYRGMIAAFATAGAAGTATNTVQSDAVIAANTIYPITVEGIISNPSATGNIQILAANDVSTANGNVLKRGSWGEIYIN